MTHTIDLKQEFVERNKNVLERFEKEAGMTVRDAMERDATSTINYLRLLGLKCAHGGTCTITGPNLKFYGYGPQVRCYDCQKS